MKPFKMTTDYSSKVVYKHPVKSAAEQVAEMYKRYYISELPFCPLIKGTCLVSCICYVEFTVAVLAYRVSYKSSKNAYKVMLYSHHCSSPYINPTRYVEQ